jgi:hypothetical protein
MENSSGYRPFGRRVAVKRLPKNSGAFNLNHEVQQEGHPDIGVIVAVGDLLPKDVLRGLEVGKTIYYTRFSPVRIPMEGEDEETNHYFVEVSNILGIKL